MKKLYKKLVLLLVLTFTILLNSASTLKIESFDVKYPFVLNKIIVILNHESSMKQKYYSVSDFEEVKPDKVVDAEPETYELIYQYLDGKEIDDKSVNLETYQRMLFLEWDNDLNGNDLLEKVKILEKRTDIAIVQPDYVYQLDESVILSRYDYVSPDIWTNYYYIKVINKNDMFYFDENDVRICVVEAQLIKSYNQIAEITNGYDLMLNEMLVQGNFKFSVPEEVYDQLYEGYEYIIKLDNYETVRNKQEHSSENIMKYNQDYLEHEFLRVINNRLYYTRLVVDSSRNDSYILNNEIFYLKFNQFIFKKTFTKNELPFEFEIEIVSDPAGDMIKILISDEEKAKMDPNRDYVYWYRKLGHFLFSGDDVLMFDEYIKLAKEVSQTNELYEPEEAGILRNNAYLNIKNK